MLRCRNCDSPQPDIAEELSGLYAEAESLRAEVERLRAALNAARAALYLGNADAADLALQEALAKGKSK